MPIYIQRVPFEISAETHLGFHVGGPLLIPNFVYVIKTNSMHYLSSVYFVNQPLHVSGIFVAHHQELYNIYIYIYIHNNWYVLCFLVDCLLAGPTEDK